MIRHFNKIEKEFITRIIEEEGYQRNILTMLDPYLEKTRLCINKSNKTIETKFEIAETHPTETEIQAAIKKIEEIQPIIVILSNLLAYLENEGLVTIYRPVNNNDQIVTAGTGAVNRKSISNKFPDQKIVDIVVSFVHKEIIPSQELVQLHSNDFISEEEKRFKKQHVATWVSIIIAGIIGIGGILYQVIDKISGKDDHKIQVEFVKAEILKLNKHLENLANEPTLKMETVTDSIHSINDSLENMLSKIEKVNGNIKKIHRTSVNKEQNIK